MIDAFGSTEGGVAVNREDDIRTVRWGSRRRRPGRRRGRRPKPPARLDADGRLLNPEECVGEIVNTTGSGPFEGYYAYDETNAAATRNGWY